MSSMISVQIVTLFGMIVTSGRESSHFRETSGPQEARHTYRVVGSQWCCTEIDGKPFAPDRNGAVLRQIQISAQSVVLVTDVSLDCSQIDGGSALHCRTVLCVVSVDPVHVDIRTVRSSEVREAKNAISVLKAVDGCCTRGGVHYCIESAGLEDLGG